MVKLKLDLKFFLNLIKLVLRYISEFNALLYIFLISLFVIKYGIKIEKESTDILVSFAAIVSTFFLFLAFRESKKTNKISMFQTYYDELYDKISNIKNKIDNSSLNEDELVKTDKLLFMNFNLNGQVTPSNFIYYLIQIAYKYTSYSELNIYNEKLDKCYVKKEVSKEICNDIYTLNLVISIIKQRISDLTECYRRIAELMQEVDKSKLVIDQKQNLISKLHLLSKDYLHFMNDVKNKKYDDVMLKLFKLKMLRVYKTDKSKFNDEKFEIFFDDLIIDADFFEFQSTISSLFFKYSD